jgi:hypothetical protein
MMMKDFFKTEMGKTLRVEESEDGQLTVEMLKDGEWTEAPRGMIGLRLAPSTKRLTAREIKRLPD